MKTKKTKSALEIIQPLTNYQKQAIILGRELVESGDLLKDKFRTFVGYCREHLTMIETDIVLIEAGFVDSRRSEIKQIASLPDDAYKPYVAGEFGVRVALEKAREQKRKKTGRSEKRKLFIPVLKTARKYFVRGGKSFSACLHAPTSAQTGQFVICLDGSQEDYSLETADGQTLRVMVLLQK